MRYRKLRIAWSVVWGLAAVLLIVLWVRSYFFNDDVYVRLWRTHLVELDSQEGSFLAQLWMYPVPAPTVVIRASSHSMQPSQYHWDDFTPSFVSSLGFHAKWLSLNSCLVTAAPHWSLVLFTAVLASIPWIRWSKRFSLRTLLIATTLVAVMLGMIVWAAR